MPTSSTTARRPRTRAAKRPWAGQTKGAHELHRLHLCPGLRRHPWHSTTSLLVPTNSRRDASPSMEPVLHRNGTTGLPKAARMARRAQRSEHRRRERVLLACPEGG